MPTELLRFRLAVDFILEELARRRTNRIVTLTLVIRLTFLNVFLTFAIAVTD
jgi:hypothetical protein